MQAEIPRHVEILVVLILGVAFLVNISADNHGLASVLFLAFVGWMFFFGQSVFKVTNND